MTCLALQCLLWALQPKDASPPQIKANKMFLIISVTIPSSQFSSPAFLEVLIGYGTSWINNLCLTFSLKVSVSIYFILENSLGFVIHPEYQTFYSKNHVFNLRACFLIPQFLAVTSCGNRWRILVSNFWFSP